MIISTYLWIGSPDFDPMRYRKEFAMSMWSEYLRCPFRHRRFLSEIIACTLTINPVADFPWI